MHASYPYRGRFTPVLGLLDTLIDGVRRGWGPATLGPALVDLRPNRILILESHLIGDQVLMLPMVEALAGAYPSAEVHVLANPWFKDLMVGFPDRVQFHSCRIPWSCYDYRLGTWRALSAEVRSLRDLSFDLAIDVRGDIRNLGLLAMTGAKRRVGFGAVSGGRSLLTDALALPPEGGHLIEGHKAVLRALGIPSEPYLPRLHPSADQVDWARCRLRECGVSPEKALGIHPGASQADRRMTRSQVSKLILEARLLGWQPVLFGGSQESLLLQEISDSLENPPPIIQASLAQFAALCGQLRQMVAMDSGPAHIAAAAGCRLIVIIQAGKVDASAPLAKHGELTLVPYEGPVELLPMERVIKAVGFRH